MGKRFREPEEFERAVAAFIGQHQMLPTGTVAGVAVSGGADSVCLLLALHALRSRLGCSLRVLHVNHGLRGAAADADEAFVAELAASLCLPFESHRLSAAEAPQSGVETWARNGRMAFFRDCLATGAVHRVATAHHRGDQAETVLFRLLRGAGSHGLGGIAPVSPAGIVRPLLSQSRESILSYLRQRGASWRTDTSNADTRFARNALRHKWIPALAAEWNPQLEALLSATADQLREESALLNDLAAEQFRTLFRAGPYGWEASRELLAALPVALQRRVVLQAASTAAADLRENAGKSLTGLDISLDFQHVETIRHLFTAPKAHGSHLLHGLRFERSGAFVRVTGEFPPDAAERKPMPVPEGRAGYFGPQGAPRRLEIRYLTGSQTDKPLDRDPNSGYTDGWSFLEFIRLRFPLTLRQWREGDAYQPAGARSKRKLKQFFQRRGIPQWKRRDELILEAEGEVIWSSSFGVSAAWLATERGAKVMALRVVESGKDWESS